MKDDNQTEFTKLPSVAAALEKIIKDQQQALKDSIEEGIITLEWILKQFPVDDILDTLNIDLKKIDDILEYASKNNPYSE